jgi:hypothetical protein
MKQNSRAFEVFHAKKGILAFNCTGGHFRNKNGVDGT